MQNTDFVYKSAVNAAALRELLAKLQAGSLDIEEAVQSLRQLPFQDLEGMARVDHHRALRVGAPEIVFGEGKSGEQIASIMAALDREGAGALASRVDPDKAKVVQAALPHASYQSVARCVVLPRKAAPLGSRGTVAVVCAGTSDLAVAEEAHVCLDFLGHPVQRYTDVGVSGLHRLLEVVPKLQACEVLIVVAGMEGALPTVVAGLVGRPIIGLPTSVGYGISQGGFAALTSMLSSCAPGLSVVNIDNGIGAAMAADRINRAPHAG